MRLNFRSIYNADFHDLFRGLPMQAVFRLVYDGILVGLVAGILSASFRWVLVYLDEERNHLLSYLEWYWVVCWFIALSLMGYAIYLLLKWEPLSGGSGIPQVEGEMMGLMDMKAPKILVSKYIGGAITSLGGFSVGREGPSIQVGAAAGKMISKLLQRSQREERILTSAGAAAGLTTAFNAPISGALFIFEEVHKSFFPVLFMPTFTAALVANYIASLLFGLEPTLGFTVMKHVPIPYVGHLVVLGIFIGCIGVIFNKSLLWWKLFYKKLSVPHSLQMILTFLAVGVISYWSLDLIGGGNQLISKISEGMHGYNTVGFLLFLLVGKIFMTCMCYGSGAQGGIFLPILVIGASAGAFFYSILLQFNWIPPDYLGNFVLASLGGVMAASMRVPMLSIMLVLEMTQSFENTYPLGVVTMVAYLVAEVLREAPIYDSLLALMKPSSIRDCDDQTLFEARLCIISDLVGKTIGEAEAKAPVKLMVIGLKRREDHILPTASLVLKSQDLLYVSCAKADLREAKTYFMNWL